MPLVFRDLHAAPSPALLNEEWILLENTGPGVVNAAGLTLSVARARGQRPHPLGTLSPGFVLQAGEKIRLVTGTASKASQGTPPDVSDGIRNYHLFLREPVLQRAGQILTVQLKQLEMARAVYAPGGEGGQPTAE